MVIEENKLSFGIHLFGYIRARTLCVFSLNHYISKLKAIPVLKDNFSFGWLPTLKESLSATFSCDFLWRDNNYLSDNGIFTSFLLCTQLIIFYVLKLSVVNNKTLWCSRLAPFMQHKLAENCLRNGIFMNYKLSSESWEVQTDTP